MAFTYDQAFAQLFDASIHSLLEQMDNRLMKTVMVESKPNAESFTVERLGHPTVTEVTGVFEPTVVHEPQHSRRIGFIRNFNVATPLPRDQGRQMVIDPRGRYVEHQAMAMMRAEDDEIIRAITGTAVAGKTGTTNVTLPTAQKIAVGTGAAARLTVQKLRQAKELLDTAEVGDLETRYLVHNGAMLRQLLEDTSITSADFNTVRALVSGNVDTFLGFKFVRSERLLTITGNVKGALAYVPSAVQFGMSQGIQTIVNVRPDRQNAWQAFTDAGFGAVRVEEERVVEIAADTSV